MPDVNSAASIEKGLAIEKDLAEKVISKALERGGDFAEVFCEDRSSVSGSFEDNKIEEFSSGSARGAGIRVISGNSTGFAHTADLSPKGLMEAAGAAASASRSTGEEGTKQVKLEPKTYPHPSRVEIYPENVKKLKKAELLIEANEAARSISSKGGGKNGGKKAGGEITQVSCGYGDKRRRILVANSDGVFTSDDQVRTFFVVGCVAVGDTGMQTGRESMGRTIGFEFFQNHEVAAMAEKAAHRALTKLEARPAPSGTMPVVVGPGGGGVLFHEACGHGLEADHIEKSASTFGGKLGTQVASSSVTLVDDGTVADEWGCYAIDDEGNPARHNVLIKDGQLVDYMWDEVRARRQNRGSSGNGRRQSYEYLPMVRMTNTYIEAGDLEPADILADTPSGVYVAELGGGQVNTATGDFVFGMTEAYLIENGKLAAPIREGNLIGNGPEVLMNIDALGNDFAFGPPGTCGKDSQGVPVGDGTPTLRVSSLTVGGTAPGG